MRLACFKQDRLKTQGQRVSRENGSTGVHSKDHEGKLVVFEMTLHIPCHVAGKTASGSKWEGKTKTVALSSFGAHLLLPDDIDLEAEASIIFHIPSALKVLFGKDTFRVKGEIRALDRNGHWLASSGQKVVSVLFNHPLRFRSWAA